MCKQVHLSTAADCEDWAAVEKDDQLFWQVFCEVAVRARRLMPGLAAATHEALAAPNRHVGVQLLHRAVAAEVMQLFGSSCEQLCVWGSAEEPGASSCILLLLRSLSQLVGHVCMHVLHRKVVLCPDERCAAMERAEFRKAFAGKDLPLTRQWMASSQHKVVAAMRGARNPAQCIAYSLLDIIAESDCDTFPWPETLWLDKGILLSLRDRLHADTAAAALMHATIGEINGFLSMDGIIKSQLVRQVLALIAFLSQEGTQDKSHSTAACTQVVCFVASNVEAKHAANEGRSMGPIVGQLFSTILGQSAIACISGEVEMRVRRRVLELLSAGEKGTIKEAVLRTWRDVISLDGDVKVRRYSRRSV